MPKRTKREPMTDAEIFNHEFYRESVREFLLEHPDLKPSEIVVKLEHHDGFFGHRSIDIQLFTPAFLRDEELKAVLPPSSAWLSSLLPPKISEDVIANLNEYYEDCWLPRHGPAEARRIWKRQAFGIVVRRWAEPVLSFALRARTLIGF